VLAGTVDLVYLRLDLFPGPVLTHEGGIDLVVEVTDVAHHGALLQRLEHVGVAHVDVAGGGDDQVGVAQQLAVDAGFGAVVDAVDVGRGDLETVHAGLHGTDRVGFGHAQYHSFLSQGIGRALDTLINNIEHLLAVDAGFGAVVGAVDVGRGDLETVHAGLHGTDRVGFGHAHYHAFLAQGLGRALAHVTITDDQRLLAGQQVVGGALDGIVQ